MHSSRWTGKTESQRLPRENVGGNGSASLHLDFVAALGDAGTLNLMVPAATQFSKCGDIDMPKPTEKPDRLSTIAACSRLEHKLTAYFAAATAAGAGALALAQPAEANVVYTPADVTIGPNSPLALDLNHDGLNDFTISNFSFGDWQHLSVNRAAAGNQVFGGASALRVGFPVGPEGRFSGFGTMATFGGTAASTFINGRWANVQNRYLGLQFSINGETHYGW